jgi:hypothetical protein
MNSSSLPNNSKDSCNNVSIRPKPYTKYTIFFRLERTYIAHSSGSVDDEDIASLDPNHYDPVEFPRPAKYAALALPPYWYSSSHSVAATKKRIHRKREGRIGLATLSKSISAAWRSADQTVIRYCTKLAQSELKKYNNLLGQEFKTKADATGNEKPLKQSEVFEDAVSTQAFTHTQASASIPCLYTKGVLNNIASEVTCVKEIDQENQVLLNELNIQALRQQLEVSEQKINELCMDLLQPTTILPVPIAKHEDSTPEKKRKCNYQVSATSLPNVKTIDGYIEASFARNNRNNRSYTHQMSAPKTPEFKIAKRKIESAFEKDTNMHNIGNRNVFIVENNISKKLDSPRNLDFLSQAFIEKRLPALPFSSRQEIKAVKEVWSLSMDVAKQEIHDSFICIPDWEKKDADTLLDILDVTQRSLSQPVSNGRIDVLLPRVQITNQQVSNMHGYGHSI